MRRPLISRRKLLVGGALGAAAAGGYLAAKRWWPRSRRRYGGALTPLVLITLDTTRADRLGCYGYPRPTSPELDRFAAGALVHERAVAPATWTLPSHASLFTGKFATSHGARKDPEGALRLTSAISGPAAWNRLRARLLAADERTLAQLLGERGYACAGFAGGPWLKRVFGLNRGFEHWDDEGITSLNGRPAEEITDRALAWLEGSAGRAPFVFLNYFEPHGPFMPPEEFARIFRPGGVPGPGEEVTAADLSALYDGEIRTMDHHLGRFFAGLERLGLFEPAWIIVTADHGELLGEHGERGHGRTPYEEVVRVPLIIKEPGGGGARGRSRERIQLVDLLAMICQRLDLPLPPGVQGGVPPHLGHPILVESRTLAKVERGGDWLAIYEGDLKLLLSSTGHNRLFDLAVDPAEEKNLLPGRARRAYRMRAELERYLAALPRPGRQSPGGRVDLQTEQVLRSLGYFK